VQYRSLKDMLFQSKMIGTDGTGPVFMQRLAWTMDPREARIDHRSLQDERRSSNYARFTPSPALPCNDKAASLRSLRTLPHPQQRGYGNSEHFRSGAEAMKTV
jgi:hypothetical protein